jgi:hypothetical protein
VVLRGTIKKGRISTVLNSKLTLPCLAIWLLAPVSVAGLGEAPAPPPSDSAFLGLETRPKVEEGKNTALVVTYIFPESAAMQMGFQVGDEVLTLNDVLVGDPVAWRKQLGRENVNAKVKFRVRRKGQVINVKGRMGSRLKTLEAHQEKVRTEVTGKPLPPLPAAVWWNPETKSWEDRQDGMDFLRGKVAVVVSFDGCKVCRTGRLNRVSALKTRLDEQGKGESVAFAGVFFQGQPGKMGKEANVSAAAAMLTSFPPTIPIATAYYPDGQPTPEQKDRNPLIHRHGVAVLDTTGNVQYIQTVGLPEQEFFGAVNKALLK